eukprot:4757740-Pleurochrysis_carterae.AAC.1
MSKQEEPAIATRRETGKGGRGGKDHRWGRERGRKPGTWRPWRENSKGHAGGIDRVHSCSKE